MEKYFVGIQYLIKLEKTLNHDVPRTNLKLYMS